MKGFVPVYFYLLHLEPPGIALAFAVAAPVGNSSQALLPALEGLGDGDRSGL